MGALTEIEDGGMVTPRRPTRRWSPHDEERHVGTSYPFPKDAVASCAGQGDLFFPENGPGTNEERRARTVLCANCPIYHACATWGQDHKEYGIWAGRRPRARG